MNENDHIPATATITADAWVNDGQGGATFGDELKITLDPTDRTRWVFTAPAVGDGLSGAVLDDGDDYRLPHPLIARLAFEGIPVDGLDEWAEWAEGEAAKARSAQMRQAVETAAAKVADARTAVAEVEETTPRGSFADRVSNTRVSLLDAIENGIPPVEYLPASEGIFVKGGRHHIAAPKKSGKSFAILSHSVRMALAGARIVILDRENGTQRYARRLQLVMDHLGLDTDQRHQVDAAISYYSFPALRKGDHDEMVAEFGDADLVVFDSQRQFLTTLGYKEDSADDYAEFMVLMIEPLFDRGIATLILDNSGHKDEHRARGSSAKGDVNDVLLSLKKSVPFDGETQGEVTLTVEESRDGSTGSWKMQIGAGVFGGFGERIVIAVDAPDPAALEQASRAVEENEGIAAGKLRNLLSGSQPTRDAAVDWLVTNGYVEREQRPGNVKAHTSIRPFRAESSPAESGGA